MKNKKYIFLTASIFIAIIAVSFLLGFGVYAGKSQTGTDLGGLVLSEQEDRYFRLLVGGKDRASGLYDVIFLVSLDRQNGSACVMQIPRDTYLEYTEGNYKKINGAPASLGGLGGLSEVLGEAMGIHLDGYLSIDLDAFGKAVDALGGVEVYVPETLYYNDPSQNLSIYIPKGKQLLDGKSAEHFVRYRSGYLRGDIGRLDAQKIFMAALFEKISSELSVADAIELAAEILPNVSTDLTFFEISELISKGMAISSEKVFFVTAPGNDVVSEQSGAWYYVISRVGVENILKSYFGAERNFDENGWFFNANSKSATDIYNREQSVNVTSVADIDKNGINIQ